MCLREGVEEETEETEEEGKEAGEPSASRTLTHKRCPRIPSCSRRAARFSAAHAPPQHSSLRTPGSPGVEFGD